MGNSARCAAWRLLSDRNRLVLTRRSKSNEPPPAPRTAESVVQNIVIPSARVAETSPGQLWPLCRRSESVTTMNYTLQPLSRNNKAPSFAWFLFYLLLSSHHDLSLPLLSSLSFSFHRLFFLPLVSFSRLFTTTRRTIVSSGKRWKTS